MPAPEKIRGDVNAALMLTRGLLADLKRLHGMVGGDHRLQAAISCTAQAERALIALHDGTPYTHPPQHQQHLTG